MECSFSKVILIIVNVIFLIFGFAFLIAGIVFKVGFEDVKDALVAKSTDIDFNLKYAGETFGLVVIIFGCAIILIAGLGCLGACCTSRILLGIYGTIMAILLLAEIVAVGVVVAKGKDATDNLQDGLSKALNGYHDAISNKTSKDHAFDAIFSTFQCCGVRNYTDFQDVGTQWDPRNTHHKIPVACCKGIDYENIGTTTWSKQSVQTCLALADDKDSYTNGCFQGLLDLVDHYKYVAIGVGVTIFLIELLVCIMAFCLCCRGDKDDYMA